MCLFWVGVINKYLLFIIIFFFQAEDGIRDIGVTGVQTCALPIYLPDGEFQIGAGGIGQMAIKMREKLVGLQHGREPDTHGWVDRKSVV